MKKIDDLSFHKFEIYDICPAHFFRKFIDSTGFNTNTHFGKISDMCCGRLLMYALEHPTFQEVAEQYKAETGRTTLDAIETERINKVLRRASNINNFFDWYRRAGFNVKYSVSREKQFTFDGRLITFRTEVDAAAYSPATDTLLIFEIKATKNHDYNTDNNLQLESNRRFIEYDDGIHKHRKVDGCTWVLVKEWDNPDDGCTAQNDPESKKKFYNNYMVPRMYKMLATPLTPEAFPENAKFYSHCKTCRFKGQCQEFHKHWY